MGRKAVLLGGGLAIILGGLLLVAMNSGPHLTVSVAGGGSRATLADRTVTLTATLDLSVVPQPYFSDPHDSEFYYQSSGPLAWLEAVQSLRPGLGWQGLRCDAQGCDARLVGLGAEEGSGVDAGLVFRATDGDQYLLLVQPQSRQLGWYRWQGGPRERLDSGDRAPYHPSFDLALIALLGEVALIGGYALAALLLLVLLAALLKPLLARLPSTPPSRWEGSFAPSWWRGGLAVALFAVALLLTGYVAFTVLDAMPHVQDSAAYIFQARTFAERRLLVPDPGAGLHPYLEHAYVLFYNGAWFSKYPPGYPLLLALGVLLGQPAIIDPLCGAAALVFVYLTGRRLFGNGVGMLAALLGLASPFFLTMSGAILSHSASMLGTAAFLYF